MASTALILAAAQITSLSFTAQVTPWQASCSPLIAGQPADCGIPTAAAAGTSPIAVDLELALALASGQATETEASFGSPTSASAGKISLYSVYPAPDSGFPPYIQVRVDLASPVRATCAESVRLRAPMELPPIVCAAISGNSAGDASVTQAGVTIAFHAK